MSRGRETVIVILLGSILVVMFVFGMRFDALEHRADQNTIELKQSIEDLRTELHALESKTADVSGRTQLIETFIESASPPLVQLEREYQELRRVVRRLQSRDF